MSDSWSSRWERPGMWLIHREGDLHPCGSIQFDDRFPVAYEAVRYFVDLLNQVDLAARADAAPVVDRPAILAGWASKAAYQVAVDECRIYQDELDRDVVRSEFDHPLSEQSSC